MEAFKYLYHGSNIDLIASKAVITEYIIDSQYILIVQDSKGEVLDIAHTNIEDYE